MMRLAFLLLLLAWSGFAGARTLQLDLGRLTHPVFVIDGLHVRLGDEGEAAELAIERFAIGKRDWQGITIRCPAFRLERVVRCRRGLLTVPGLFERAAIDLHFDTRNKSGKLNLRISGRETIDIVMRPDGRIVASLAGLAVARLGKLLDLASWNMAGRLAGRIEYSPTRGGARIQVSGKLESGRFSQADGLRAAEGLGLDIDLRARRGLAGWDWQGRMAWNAGEAYLHPLYLVAGPVIEAAGRLEADVLTVARARLELEGVRTIAATAEIGLQPVAVRSLAFSLADADLAVVGPRYLAPAFAPAATDRLHFSGHVSAAATVEEGVPTTVDLAFDEAGFSLSDKELSFGPLTGVVPWRAEARTEARLAVAGGRWQKLGLGAFELVAQLDGQRVDVGRVAIPVLDGALVLERLALVRDATGWHGRGAAVVEPISMALLAEAAGLPAMSGVLSASLPGLRVAPGEISLDGALVISVFGGYLQATRLQLFEPFGVASHLYADVQARHLDLGQLTEAFSFGSVSGFVDADVLGLELAGWQPVRFDARVVSSPGSYPRRISQRAVQNISALGGPGAVAALQRGLLGVFETFGYREIGISCVLRNGVCRMGGLDDPGAPGDGYYIVRGGGVPALNVIGYNRRVDWNELIDRLQRVIASNAPPVIQ
ncbi:hypothetical protein [Aromatoleum aromaticum]|uniref:Dicarboxylate transport domain-containing protein n=2 Tax=Aromatoleum aromaticum TaxID=551760 RepID=Q5P7V8_AROAE|nr:hypothetical protein [Aromatoleum aromaticum]CAI06603.1 conserved hypothetical protein [Aromatoleum aromaticum EbN1]